MICLISTTLYLIFISYVTGSLSSKILNSNSGLIEKIFLGIAVSNAVFSLISLFLPINSIVSFSYLLVCVVYFLLNFRNISSFKIQIVKPQNLFFLTYPVIILYGFFNSLYAPLVYDSGLYHIQAIEWIERYAVIPGLANLHDRFGFNPNIFILFAATSFDDILNQDAYPINFTLFLLFTAWLLNRINKEFKLKNYIYGFSNIVILIILINNLHLLSSPTPDLICIVIPLFIFLRYLEINRQNENNPIMKYYPIIVMSLYIITVKLSTLPILILIPIIIFQYRKKLNLKELFPIIIFTFLIIVPWMIRNLIISGWLIFPFSGIDLFTFDWKVPSKDVNSLKEAISGWGRNPGQNFRETANLSLSKWFPLWWTAQSDFKRVIFVILSFSPILVIIFNYLTNKRNVNKSFLIVYLVSYLGFLFWFFTAPDWRFGLAFITMCFLSLFFFKDLKINFYSNYFVSILSLILIAYIIYTNQNTLNYVINNYEKVSNIPPKIQKSNKKGKVQFESFNIDNKIIVKYPIDDYRCFDEDIPCSSYLKTNIHLRGEDIKSGFYVKTDK